MFHKQKRENFWFSLFVFLLTSLFIIKNNWLGKIYNN
jgi:hypothetical protein